MAEIRTSLAISLRRVGGMGCEDYVVIDQSIVSRARLRDTDYCGLCLCRHWSRCCPWCHVY